MPVILLCPRPRVVVPLGVALGAAGAGLLMLDSLVFAENRYHLNALTFMLLAPQTWGFLALYVAVGVAIEAMLASWVWQRTAQPPGRRIGRYLAVGLAACFVAGHLVHAWAEARSDVRVTAFTRYLPLYYPPEVIKLQVRLGLVDRTQARARGVAAAVDGPPAGELRYPLAPLRCEFRAPPLNVLLVVIDAMRPDALTEASAPRLAAFARGAIQFDQHWSGGNSSRAGMFSLFYSLPATYWDAFAQAGPAAGADGPLPSVRLPARAVRQLAGLRRRWAGSDGPGRCAASAVEDELALSGVQREGPGPDRGMVWLARPAGSGAAFLRLPVLQRGGRARAAR